MPLLALVSALAASYGLLPSSSVVIFPGQLAFPAFLPSGPCPRLYCRGFRVERACNSVKRPRSTIREGPNPIEAEQVLLPLRRGRRCLRTARSFLLLACSSRSPDRRRPGRSSVSTFVLYPSRSDCTHVLSLPQCLLYLHDARGLTAESARGSPSTLARRSVCARPFLSPKRTLPLLRSQPCDGPGGPVKKGAMTAVEEELCAGGCSESAREQRAQNLVSNGRALHGFDPERVSEDLTLTCLRVPESETQSFVTRLKKYVLIKAQQEPANAALYCEG